MSYIAMGTLSAPGTLVAGYRRGDPVADSVVENWGLVVGEDVAEGELPEVDGPPPMVRPRVEDTRATWERWAISNGMSPEDAAEVSQEELEDTGPADEGAASDPDRPADSAKKAEWVAYVQGRAGGDEQTEFWAADDSTTKAQLQAWRPGQGVVGDPVALAATEQANG